MSEILANTDFTNGTDGQIQFIKDGEVITLYGSQKAKATTSPEVSSRGQIGSRQKQSKIKNFNNKLTITADYWTVSLMTEWLLEFKGTGKFPKIDCQMVNHDKGTSLGMMSKVFYDLVPDGEITLQELDESANDGLMTELTFTFSDWDSLQNFGKPKNIRKE